MGQRFKHNQCKQSGHYLIIISGENKNTIRLQHYPITHTRDNFQHTYELLIG